MGEPITVERTFTREITLVTKNCQGPECDKEYVGAPSRRYCSRSCQRRAAYQHRRQRLREEGKPITGEHVMRDWSEVLGDG